MESIFLGLSDEPDVQASAGIMGWGKSYGRAIAHCSQHAWICVKECMTVRVTFIWPKIQDKSVMFTHSTNLRFTRCGCRQSKDRWLC